jgi:hypothetical protein
MTYRYVAASTSSTISIPGVAPSRDRASCGGEETRVLVVDQRDPRRHEGHLALGDAEAGGQVGDGRTGRIAPDQRCTAPAGEGLALTEDEGATLGGVVVVGGPGVLEHDAVALDQGLGVGLPGLGTAERSVVPDDELVDDDPDLVAIGTRTLDEVGDDGVDDLLRRLTGDPVRHGRRRDLLRRRILHVPVLPLGGYGGRGGVAGVPGTGPGTVVEVVDTPATSDPAGSPQAATSTSRAHPRARRFVMSWFPLNAVCTYDARGAVAGSRHSTDSGRVRVKVLHPPAWS